MNKEEFIKEFDLKYKYKYTLLNDFVDEKTEILTIHNLCGYKHLTLPETLLKGKHKCNCSKQTKGEYLIEHSLINNGINYISQYSFEDLKYKRKLKFDYGLFDKGNNLKFLLEFDGDFHNKNIYGDLEKQKLRDSIKEKYCEENEIPLERIEYKKINELDDILADLYIKYNLFDDKEGEKTPFSLFKYEDEEGNIMKVVKVDGLVKRNNEIYNVIGDFLDKHDVIVKSRYIIPECRHLNPLPFGFALFNPDNNELITLIDPICESHIKITYRAEDLEDIVYHDALKEEFCNDNNLEIERIYFWSFDNIYNKLLKIMKKYNIQYIPE